jgi:hypothetical protein
MSALPTLMAYIPNPATRDDLAALLLRAVLLQSVLVLSTIEEFTAKNDISQSTSRA